MNPDRILGSQAEVLAEVTEAMCPAWDGVVIHRVYSTWSMGHHMELAGRKVLLPHLDADEEGLGSKLEIEHLGPLPVGRTARAVARCVEADRTTVVCEIATHDHETGRVVGRGRHVQRLMKKSLLTKWIERHR